MSGEISSEGNSETQQSCGDRLRDSAALAVSRFYLYTIKRHCWKSLLLVNKMACLSSKQDPES